MARRRKRSSGAHGVMVVDKPPGMTSHDVVQRLRRGLGEGRIGHAGTLDPAATGVLIVMVGQATKLGPYLSAEDKSYLATIALGSATDTLDADGVVVASAPLPSWWQQPDAVIELERALAGERERRLQQPPNYSAIKIDGRAAYARARAGEALELDDRPVSVRCLQLLKQDVAAGSLTLSLAVSKGYYVRSLARDLCHALGTVGHLAALRRTASGAFELNEAVALEPLDCQRLRAALLPLATAACRALPTSSLTETGVDRARHGGPMAEEHFVAGPADGVSAWLDPAGELVAIGKSDGEVAQVLRGFAPADGTDLET